jgi:hypothetical protein
MAGRGGAGRSRTLAPLVAAGALLPGPNVLSCSVAGRDYYAGEGGGRGGGQGAARNWSRQLGGLASPSGAPLPPCPALAVSLVLRREHAAGRASRFHRPGAARRAVPSFTGPASSACLPPASGVGCPPRPPR